jgi:hypothetical protein
LGEVVSVGFVDPALERVSEDHDRDLGGQGRRWFVDAARESAAPATTLTINCCSALPPGEQNLAFVGEVSEEGPLACQS